MASELEEKAQSEHRLGLLMLENRSGVALSAGVPHFRAAAEIWQQAGWPTRRAEVLVDLGRLHTKAGNHADAAAAHGEALRIFDSANDSKRAVDAALGAGTAQLAAGAVEEALRLLKRGVELASQLNDHLRMAASMLDLARAQVAEARTLRPAAAHEAIATCEKARKIFDAFKRRMQVAESHELQAQAHAAAGEFPAAAANYETSARIHDDLGRSYEANEVLGNWAAMERDRGAHAAAIAIHQRCIDRFTKDGNKAMLAQSLRRVGMVHAKAGDDAQALQCYQHSLDLCRMVDDHAGASRSLYLLGTTALRAGREAEGLAHLDACIAAAKANGDIAHQEEALAALVSHHRTGGRHQQALDLMRNWVEALRERGERQDQIRILGDIAEVEQEAGAFGEAEAHLRKLVEVCTQPDDQAERNRAHHSLGTLLSRRGVHREAYEHFKAALAGFGDGITPVKRAQILYQMGNACLNNQEAEQALLHLDQALVLCDDKLRAKVLVGIGNAKAMLGHSGEAKTIFDEAADLCEKQGDVRATTIIRRATQTLA